MNNDLISRSKAIEELNYLKHIGYDNSCVMKLQNMEIQRCISVIEDVPAVEPKKVLVANVTFDEDKLKDIVQTEVIEKIKSGELVIKDERPKGEWTSRETDGTLYPFWERYECSVCKAYGSCNDNFCPNCGADMRKGGAECNASVAELDNMPMISKKHKGGTK